MDTTTKAIAERWTGRHCYLIVDGKEYPATIRGRLQPFAQVAPTYSEIPPVEFSWHTVNRIMYGKMEFHA